jgi:cytidine deaminase
MTEDIKKLYDMALTAMNNAHCPISHYKVGAAVEMADGKLYAGCNVESITFTISTHAEMNAIDTAVAQGSKELRRVLVITDEEKPAFPCALCRQKIIEFGAATEVIAANLAGDIIVKNISELYPEPFVTY